MPDDSSSPAETHRDKILAALRDAKTFLRMTLAAPSGKCPWQRAAVRPVLIRSRRHFQIAHFAGKKHVTRNVPADEIAQALDSLLALGFTQVHVQTATGDLHVRLTRKGKALMTRGRASQEAGEPRLEHDHVKSYPLPLDKPDAFLHQIGIMTADGKVKAAMFAKFRQINEFLRLIEQETGELPAGEGVRLVDCGCGSAYLTFAAFHYLRDVKGLAVQAVGVDVNADLIGKCRALRDKLGWPELDFQVSAIADYQPPRRPDVVVSLHACDRATDEALARGVAWGSRVILAAPCCQHELHHLLDEPSFRGVLRHGLLRERLADIVTDALRAAALRVMGYHARVFEFISPEHTSKNLMIAARKIAGPDPGRPAAAKEYLTLKRFWNVTPFIEPALGEAFQEAIAEK